MTFYTESDILKIYVLVKGVVKLFHRKRKSNIPAEGENEDINAGENSVSEEKSVPEKKKSRSLKIAAGAVILVAAAAAGVLIFSSISGSEGSRKAQKLAKKIGEPTEKAASFAKTELSESSDFTFIGELCDYTSLAESSRTTHVYDVKVPEWTIFCSENTFGKLDSVTYYDFRVLSSSINGVKKSSKIDTSKITSGCTLSEVNEILNMDPYQVVYSQNTVSRKYRYYYNDKQSSDTKAFFITVMFGSDNTVNAPAIVESNNFIYEILSADSY